jgi:hypothetical protein
MQEFAKIFRSLPDPRAPNALHELLDILVIALAATLCGAKCATDMELFGQSKEKLLGNSCSWNMEFPATIRSAASSALWTPKLSGGSSSSSCWHLPKPTASSLPGWWQSMAKLCAAPTSEARAARRTRQHPGKSTSRGADRFGGIVAWGHSSGSLMAISDRRLRRRPTEVGFNRTARRSP